MAQGAERTAIEGDWICANCGTSHKTNNQPCRECAGERFARLEPETTSRIDSSATVEYRCRECRKIQPKNSTPCDRCGNVTFEPVDQTDNRDDGQDVQDIGGDGQRQITAVTVAAYLYGGFGLLSALAAIILGELLPAALWGIGGVIAVPVLRRSIETHLSVSFSRGAILAVVITTHLFALGARM